MRAIVVKQPGGPEVLQLAEVPDPQPREGDLIVRVRAAGVNRADLHQRLGRYPPPPGEQEAAAIPEAFLTAWLNLATLGALQPGHVVVVHAAAGGVGSAALQLCRGIASVVLATASAAKLDACRALGATHVLARDQVPSRLPEAVRAASGGRGADIILDVVGGAYLEANVAALGLHGRLCCISTQSGSKGTLDIGALLVRRLTVLGSTLRTRSAEQKARLVADFSARVLPRFERGELRPVIARTYPLADAARAHEDLESDRVVGKIILIP